MTPSIVGAFDDSCRHIRLVTGGRRAVPRRPGAGLPVVVIRAWRGSRMLSPLLGLGPGAGLVAASAPVCCCAATARDDGRRLAGASSGRQAAALAGADRLRQLPVQGPVADGVADEAQGGMAYMGRHAPHPGRLRPPPFYLQPAGGISLRIRMGGLRGHSSGSSIMRALAGSDHAVVEFHPGAQTPRQLLLARNAFHLYPVGLGGAPRWARRLQLAVVGEQQDPSLSRSSAPEKRQMGSRMSPEGLAPQPRRVNWQSTIWGLVQQQELAIRWCHLWFALPLWRRLPAGYWLRERARPGLWALSCGGRQRRGRRGRGGDDGQVSSDAPQKQGMPECITEGSCSGHRAGGNGAWQTAASPRAKGLTLGIQPQAGCRSRWPDGRAEPACMQRRADHLVHIRAGASRVGAQLLSQERPEMASNMTIRTGPSADPQSRGFIAAKSERAGLVMAGQITWGMARPGWMMVAARVPALLYGALLQRGSVTHRPLAADPPGPATPAPCRGRRAVAELGEEKP